jgi:hypothetical protein
MNYEWISDTVAFVRIKFMSFVISIIEVFVVCFPGVTTHCGCTFHSPAAGFILLVLEVS